MNNSNWNISELDNKYPNLAKVINFVDQAFEHKNTAHFVQTVYWLLQLEPDADEALILAAYAHDIQRAFGDGKRRVFLEEDELEQHQQNSGEIIYKFLINENTNQALAKDVRELVSKHETGGTQAQNLLKDADSLSYFEVNAAHHASWDEFQKKLRKKKFDWMYNRISSDKAKKIAEPMYKEMLKLLDNE